MRYLYLFSTLLSLASAKTQPDPSRIVGGSIAAIETYPYAAALQYSNLGILWSLECTGTLLSARNVLTAAHCLDGRPASNWRVRIGSAVAVLGSTIAVTRANIHPEYSAVSLDYDVAVLRLAAAAALTSEVQFARLAGRNYILRDGAPVTAIGWGATQPGGETSTILQTVELDVINQGVCSQRYAGLANSLQVSPRMLCAGVLNEGGRGTCAGDDGGPVIFKGEQVHAVVGITSWRQQCGDPQYPEVFVNISELVDWIIQSALFM